MFDATTNEALTRALDAIADHFTTKDKEETLAGWWDEEEETWVDPARELKHLRGRLSQIDEEAMRDQRVLGAKMDDIQKGFGILLANFRTLAAEVDVLKAQARLAAAKDTPRKRAKV